MVEITPLETSSLNKFKVEFSQEFKNADLTLTRFLNSDLNQLSSIPGDEMAAQSFPVVLNGKVTGRYFESITHNTGIYIDYSNYKQKITIYSGSNKGLHLTGSMVLDVEKGQYVFSGEYLESTFQDDNSGGIEQECLKPWRFAWCSAGCGFESAGIAVLDGPAPVMDIVAYNYLMVCIAACGAMHCYDV